MSLFQSRRNKIRKKEQFQKIRNLLETEFGWNASNTLTPQGKKLVKDTIEAYDKCQQQPKK